MSLECPSCEFEGDFSHKEADTDRDGKELVCPDCDEPLAEAIMSEN